jgi:hypothetical protein
MVDEKFEAASRAMELWPEMVVLAQDAAREHNYGAAAQYLERLEEERTTHSGPIRRAREELVLVSHVTPSEGCTSQHAAVLERVDNLLFALLHEIGLSAHKYADKIVNDGPSAAFEDYLADRGPMIFDMQKPIDWEGAKEAKVRLCWERAEVLASAANKITDVNRVVGTPEVTPDGSWLPWEERGEAYGRWSPSTDGRKVDSKTVRGWLKNGHIKFEGIENTNRIRMDFEDVRKLGGWTVPKSERVKTSGDGSKRV